MTDEVERLRREVARGAGAASAKRLAWLLERQEGAAKRRRSDLNAYGCVFVCIYDAYRHDGELIGAGWTAAGTLSGLRSILQRRSRHDAVDINPVIEWAKDAPPGATSSCGEVIWIFAADLDSDEEGILELEDYEAWRLFSGRGGSG